MKFWQESMLDQLVSYFEPQEDVLGLLLFGSLSKPDFQPDHWSDLDVLVVVRNDKLEEFFPTIEWIATFGRLYTYSQSADEFKCTTRACFENFNRIDFVITTEGNLAEINRWPSIPFSSGAQVMFSRSEIVDEIANQTYPQQELSLTTQEQFLEVVRNFRFKSMLAVYKVVRNDLLIALHLAQDLIRDCCVLGMMLRDRAMGTNIRKQGAMGNEIVTELGAAQKPFTAIGIVDSIKASSEVFEKLASKWSPGYEENRQVLLDWIEKAKIELQQ
jgi:predicted nucleotidyltransferase